VQAEAYFQFMNPLVFLLFAAGFFCINAIRPSTAVLMLALSYLFGAAAFTVDIFEQAGIHIVGVIPIAGLYAITAILVSSALSLHYRGWAPWLFFGALFAGHMAFYSWTFLHFGSSWASSLAANFGCGLMFATGALLIRNYVRRTIDKVVFWLSVFGAAQCFVRPLLVAYLAGGMTPETFDFGMFILLLHFVVGTCAVVLGMTLLVAFSSEIMADLEKRSVTDRLSGLLNRRGFEDAVAEALQTKAEDVYVSVILADIDHFKQVNDTQGHAAGDMVIAEMGALFNQYADRSRFAGRIGGEEFAMALVGEPLQTAREIAEALRRDFSALRIDNGDPAGGDCRFTASFGVAMRQPGEPFLSLLSRADEALYLAKAKGRDKVICETDVLVQKLRGSRSAEPPPERRKFRDTAVGE
jgi:diguanylate cyclase (GGDEF)-like protein